jgi:putative addiction module antidote
MEAMVVELKLRKIGNSVGVVLPKEVLNHLKVGEGDTICVTETVDGSLRVGPSNDEFKKQMEAAESVINRYRNTLRELAK